MNTEKTLELVSNSLEDTYQLAEKIGRRLKGGEVIELVSDISGGKTAFVRGLAAGVNSTDQVASPTFTISRHYRSGDKDLEIHHYDFYRLGDNPGLMSLELVDSIGMPHVVTVIEWAQAVNEVLPNDRLTVEITATGESSRHFLLKFGTNHEHLETEV